MGFECGIVGLPNVGKSTLFNALTRTAAAQAANYPFCTIEPNSGEVTVPDERLAKIADIAQSAVQIPSRLVFVDIAGLVKGASRGEGLGNQFLANIRKVDAIAHVLRCFDESDVVHVEGRVDPTDDARIVETELMLADLQSLEKRIIPLAKKAQSGDRRARSELAIMEPVKDLLAQGRPARNFQPGDDAAKRMLKELDLLTTKPVLFVGNIDENSLSTENPYEEQIEELARESGAGTIYISAGIEAELAQMEAESAEEFREAVGLNETGLSRLIRAGYDLLDLITFFTAGPKEARAWTIKSGRSAQKAAGVIHTDFERGFIRAQTISYEDFIACGGEAGAKRTGKMREEGKDYLVRDGDVMHFRFNV